MRPLESLVCCAVSLSIIAFQAAPTLALNPDSPAVKAMVDKATTFLESTEHNALGGKCIIAYALLKADREKYLSHPQVKMALEACQLDQGRSNDTHLYSTAMAALFLCEHSAMDNSQLIKKYISNIVARQKSHGGWGYRDRTRGDTSQTQYAILALWTADRKHIAIPIDSLERATNWLIQVQDPAGAWGYQAILPSSGQRTPQVKISRSLTSASLGSLYIMGDTLKLADFAPAPVQGPVVEIDAPKVVPLTNNVDVTKLKSALRDGNQWFVENFDIAQDDWNYYYLYAIERYMSFKDHVESREEKNPRWYDAGITLLKSRQQPDGRFAATVGVEEGGDAIGTAFATLFMVRSSQKSLKTFDGTTQYIPILDYDLDQIRIDENGSVILPFEIPDDVTIPTTKISKLLVSDDKTRLKTVHQLANNPTLDDVPALLFALIDPSTEIAHISRNALRKFSRKIDGFGMPNNATQEQKSLAQFQWKEWYLAIRPDADLKIDSP
ncbi:MAG: prenyltransferase beta subunit [Pirellulaceae bacterium]|jgi:prenyltransferase beta subunit